jgi:predicted alpha/beta hydrolase
MAAQDRSWRRRRAPLVQRHGVVLCELEVGVRTLFLRVLPSSFEGCGAQVAREWAAQCHGVDTDLPA